MKPFSTAARMYIGGLISWGEYKARVKWRAGKMKKEECIKRYGEAAYAKKLQQTRAWKVANPDKVKAQSHAWHAAHRDEKNA